LAGVPHMAHLSTGPLSRHGPRIRGVFPQSLHMHTPLVVGQRPPQIPATLHRAKKVISPVLLPPRMRLPCMTFGVGSPSSTRPPLSTDYRCSASHWPTPWQRSWPLGQWHWDSDHAPNERFPNQAARLTQPASFPAYHSSRAQWPSGWCPTHVCQRPLPTGRSHPVPTTLRHASI
jgi:hypothetical protein